MTQGYEWADMPERMGETEDNRSRRGPYYATFKRIEQNKDFFEQIWHLQPKCMVVFGRQIEESFTKLHKARRHVEVAAQMLAQQIGETLSDHDRSTRELYQQLRRDVWDHGDFEKEKDRVGQLLKDFELELEAAARPILEKEYKTQK